MNETKFKINQLLTGLPSFSATTLANKISAITKEVIKGSVTVITNHNTPAMVLMSVDRYVQLEQAARHDLDALTEEFNTLYAQMQESEVKEKTLDALDLDR